MRISEFDYDLPRQAIAQHPLKERDQSRLLVIRRKTGALEDRKFFELPEYVSPADAIVANNCRVIPARIFGKRGTGARLEITLLGKVAGDTWECLVKGKKPRPGEEVEIGQGAKIIFKEESHLDEAAGFLGGLWRVEFKGQDDRLLEKLGVAPLPPYIKRDSPEEYAEDRIRYQTIFALENGAVAAPTAGLHFTERVIQDLKTKGLDLVEITLFVSYGTFAPVRVEKIEDHKMHSEKYKVSQAAAQKINSDRARGGKVIAIGTTVARTLEAVAQKHGAICAAEGETDLFITPGFQFQTTDALLTNFHMPRSTLLMLVAAFAGTDLIKKAYEHALQKGYRFLSYGDCMLIL